MRLDSRFLGWGVFLVVLGAVPLAAGQGLIDRTLLAGVWRLWPLILIGIGLGLVLRGTAAGLLGGLLVAATAGLIAGSALTVGPAVVGGCGQRDAAASRQDGEKTIGLGGPLPANGAVYLEFSCGRLTITTGGSEWRLEALEPSEREPRIRADQTGLHLAPADDSIRFMPFDEEGAQRDWSLTLPTAMRVLEADVNAADARLDLGEADLRRLTLSINASTARIDLRQATVPTVDLDFNASRGTVLLPALGTRGELEVNAGDVHLCPAPGVGLQLIVSGALSDTDFRDDGLVRAGERWRSPDYETAGARVDLTVSANAADVDIVAEADCA